MSSSVWTSTGAIISYCILGVFILGSGAAYYNSNEKDKSDEARAVEAEEQRIERSEMINGGRKKSKRRKGRKNVSKKRR
jgi:hypothetical protein